MPTIYPNGKLRPDNPGFELFKKKFVQSDISGAWKLTSDGCMMRHQRPRAEMDNTKQESKVRNLETYNRADVEEYMMQNALCTWLSRGFKIRESETVEEFVERCNQDHNRMEAR